MYFVVAGQHPAFGYVDQPPLTPLLSAASVALLGVTPTAVRVLPAIWVGGTIRRSHPADGGGQEPSEPMIR